MDSTQLEIIYAPARQLVRQLQTGECSAREVMQAFLARIEACNPKVNAICTLMPYEQALALADDADRARIKGDKIGSLHGLPFAVKDLSDTRGMRTTLGSPIFADNVPDRDSLLAQRIRQAGALVIGKTNTPEFGAGSHTFNTLFGVTRNPYNLHKTAGGSSGGAAAAVACGMLPLADGSDMGGSLRNPAAFCNIVGFRPSLGRVPHWPTRMAWQSRLGVEGPLARDVQDCALLFSVLAGPDARDPLSLQEHGEQFLGDFQQELNDCRIAWTPDLGLLPVEREVVNVCEAALPALENCGFRIETAHPGLDGAMDVFKTLRAAWFAEVAGPSLARHRHLMKDTVIGNIEYGLKLRATDITRADTLRTKLYQRLLEFFRRYDFLALPSVQVQPFDCDTEWIREIEGHALSDYIDWMSICCMISIFGTPAISIPAGFTSAGLPVGLQLTGRPRADAGVLAAARLFEQETDFHNRRPAL